MTTNSDESRGRLTLCLVADDEVVERFPAMVRYLQVGLIDEPIDTILVLPDSSRSESLVTGSATTIPYARRRWLADRITSRTVLRPLTEKLESLPRDQPVVVHALSITVAPLAERLASELGAELVANVASSAFRYLPHTIKALDRAAVLILPASGFRADVQSSGMASKRIEVIRPGVPLGSAPASFESLDRVPSIIFSGGLTHDGGADVLLRSVARVVRGGQRLLLVIAGKGPAEADLRRLSASLGLTEMVTFTGRFEHLHAAIGAAELFCIPRALPAFREDSIHAMAAGLAIIAAEGTYCDGLVDHETALLVPSGDEMRLADAMERLISSPDDAWRLGSAAHATAKSLFSIATMVAGYVRVYEQIALRSKTLTVSADAS